MSSLTPKPKFLLDENVRADLAKFLQSQGLDVKHAPKASPDSHLVSLSKTEKRILVTNDEDFAQYTNDSIFSVVWLRILQNDPQSLLTMFDKLLKECKDFKGKFIVLEKNIWKDVPLPTVQSM